MGTQGKMMGVRGCDYVGIETFVAPAGKQIFMFKTNETGTIIDEFDEIPVSVINNDWTPGLAADAETVDDRTYCSFELGAGMEIFFDGPVISITVSAGSGVVYYISGDNPGPPPEE